MNNGWIKSYRKAQYHEIWKDQNAWRVFQWLIWNVDYETGKGSFGRKQISQGTGLNESTIYKVTQRLTTKWQAIGMKSNNRFTTFSVLNWSRYQASSENVTQEVTTKEQVAVTKSNTIKEIKNKNKEIRNIEREGKIPLSYLLEIPENDLEEFTTKFKCSRSQVIEKAESLVDYVKTHSAKYSDHKALLRNALRKDFGKRPLEVATQILPDEISVEQRDRNRQRIAEIRSNFKSLNLKNPMPTYQEEQRRAELMEQARHI